MATSCERPEPLPDASGFLKPGVNFKYLDRQAAAIADLEAEKRLNRERAEIFDRIFELAA